MKKTLFLSFLFLTFLTNSAFALFQQAKGIESSQIKRIVISHLDPSFIFVASKNSLYKSQDSGRNFKKIAVFKDEEIQHIFFDQYLADTLYIATTRHFYQIQKRLKQLFFSSDEEVLHAAAQHKNSLYIGTTKGLYYKSKGGSVWKKIAALANFPIYHIEPAKELLYLASKKGVYSFESDDRVERLFITREAEEAQEQSLISNIIKVDLFNDSRLWLGSNKGIFISEDKGITWRKIYSLGINNLSINCFAQTKLKKNSIYFGATKGLFVFDLSRDSAKQIFEGLPSSDILWIEFTLGGRMYVATPKGLFRSNYFTQGHLRGSIEGILLQEPSINEIQQVALKYNEVHPEKIAVWRRSLKYRAMFPTVNLDYDKTINYDSGSDKYYIGPRDWGVSFSWDVGDLVWDTYQDDIDTRSRLNTQLRLDLLDEINRVYFERLRLKKEIINSSLAKEELFTKELRLAELTAILDGYTGGFFSKKIKELNEG